MDDFLKFALGSAWLTALVTGLLLVVKNAIATAVSQAGQRELARLTSDLRKERDKASREGDAALELFRSQLTLDAEVRRQVAARKVQALLDVMSAGQVLAVNLNAADAANSLSEGTAQWLKISAEYMQKVRALQPLVSRQTGALLIRYGEEVARDVTTWRAREDFELFKAAIARVGDLLAVARRELFVDEGDAAAPGENLS